MTRVKENTFRGGERHAQHNRRLPLTGLPDVAYNGFGFGRLILRPEPTRCCIEPEGEKALLWLWLDV